MNSFLKKMTRAGTFLDEHISFKTIINQICCVLSYLSCPHKYPRILNRWQDLRLNSCLQIPEIVFYVSIFFK